MAIEISFETEEQAKSWALELIKQSKREIPSNIFKEVQLHSEEFVAINKDYPFAVEQGKKAKHCLNRANFPYVENLEFNEAGTSALTIGGYDIHDLMRKLTLAIYGVRKNKDMNPRDFEAAQAFYKTVKDLFLEEYRNRLEKIKGEIA